MIVDVSFGLRGTTIPTDHGYLLYGAVTKVLPELHGAAPQYALHPVRGRQLPDRLLALERHSEVVFRLDHALIPWVLPLAGKSLRVGRYTIAIGTPSVTPLCPAPVLSSRIVVIKGFTEAEGFRAAAQRQLSAAAIVGEVSLPQPRSSVRFEGRSQSDAGPVRRTLRVRDKEIVGFAIQVAGLSDADSIRLQEIGLGGRQHFGCGVLVPVPKQPSRP